MRELVEQPRFVFFGTPDIAVYVLDELEQAGFVPELVVTNPDRPIGRKQILTAPPVRTWADTRGIVALQAESLRDDTLLTPLKIIEPDLFIVAAYGKLIPAQVLAIPKFGTLNVHPSLLPKLRGASPIRSAILGDVRETGVSVMLLDTELDHGPIVAQEQTTIDPLEWPLRGRELDKLMARQGGALLAKVLPDYLAGTITPTEQEHAAATFCTKITKDTSELRINPKSLPFGKEAYDALLKIRAFDGWPETYFMHEEKRIKIKDAELAITGQLRITRIVPEGKSEMDFSAYFGD